MINSKGNRNVVGKLVYGPPDLAAFIFWPTTRERLPNPELDHRPVFLEHLWVTHP